MSVLSTYEDIMVSPKQITSEYILGRDEMDGWGMDGWDNCQTREWVSIDKNIHFVRLPIYYPVHEFELCCGYIMFIYNFANHTFSYEQVKRNAISQALIRLIGAANAHCVKAKLNSILGEEESKFKDVFTIPDFEQLLYGVQAMLNQENYILKLKK